VHSPSKSTARKDVVSDRGYSGVSLDKGPPMSEQEWNSLEGGGIMLVLPLYLKLQEWFAIRWRGTWRIVALIPLFVFVPFLAYSLFALSRGSNIWLLLMIFFAPVGFGFLMLASVARWFVGRSATPGSLAGG
jgi:hypothetical protein